VIVVGVDRRVRREPRRRRDDQIVGPSSTTAPSLRSSVAIAAMRSVSFTRQLAMLRSVLVPSQSAATAIVIAASGIRLKSMSIGSSLP
jgi:hypothetical protein